MPAWTGPGHPAFAELSIVYPLSSGYFPVHLSSSHGGWLLLPYPLPRQPNVASKEPPEWPSVPATPMFTQHEQERSRLGEGFKRGRLQGALLQKPPGPNSAPRQNDQSPQPPWRDSCLLQRRINLQIRPLWRCTRTSWIPFTCG